MTLPSFTITPRGPFSLAELASFGFGQRLDPVFDGVMRMAFCLDDYRSQVGVEIRQDDKGRVHGVVHGLADANPDAALDAARGQVARVLSLDHDGREFVKVGARDAVIGRLQAATPGLRPPLFYSPYEAAMWAVLSARRPARQMAEVRRRLSERHGAIFDLAAVPTAALPTPEQLLAVDEVDGLTAQKLERMHAIARAALDGQLDVAALAALEPSLAMDALQELPGIGPFYSALIVIRALGHTDVLPADEPKALAMTAQLYGLPAPPSRDELEVLAEAWKPFRTWAVVLIRAAGARVDPDAA
jgi:DNA-3-methyladenine glycosylase II